MNSGSNSTTERLMITKYYFQKITKTNLPADVMECCWKQYISHRTCFSNLKSEISCLTYDLYQKNKEDIQLQSYFPEHSLQMHSLTTLIDGLGVKSTIDCKKVIKRANLESVLSNGKLLKDIDTFFDLGKIKGKDEKKLCNRRSLGLIISALNSWYGSKLIKIKESRKQVHDKDGKKLDIYDYKLQNKFEEELMKYSSVTINSLHEVYLF